jgi:hypothetical protein
MSKEPGRTRKVTGYPLAAEGRLKAAIRPVEDPLAADFTTEMATEADGLAFTRDGAVPRPVTDAAGFVRVGRQSVPGVPHGWIGRT